MATKDCKNGCPPGTDMRTCMLAFMDDCPFCKSKDGDIFFKETQEEKV